MYADQLIGFGVHVNSDSLLGFAAILTAVGGGVASIYTVISGRRDAHKEATLAVRLANEECYEKLISVRREAEEMSGELHEFKMGRKKGASNDETT